MDLGQLIKRIAFSLLVVGLSLLLLQMSGAVAGGSRARLVPRLAGIGSLLVFFSPYLGGGRSNNTRLSGSRGIRYPQAGAAVPWVLWRILGVAVWIIGGICFFALDG